MNIEALGLTPKYTKFRAPLHGKSMRFFPCIPAEKRRESIAK